LLGNGASACPVAISVFGVGEKEERRHAGGLQGLQLHML